MLAADDHVGALPSPGRLGVRRRSDSREAAFEKAAAPFTAVITDPDTVSCRESVTIECEAPDLELLFVDWLNALIYEMATRRMLFCHFSVVPDGTRLHTTACGEAIEVTRHQPAAEVKAKSETTVT